MISEAIANNFQNGLIIDAILALMLIEAVVLATHYRRHGRGLPWPELVVNLGAGAALMLALRSALTTAAWGWTALFMGLALIAHLADLRTRWRG